MLKSGLWLSFIVKFSFNSDYCMHSLTAPTLQHWDLCVCVCMCVEQVGIKRDWVGYKLTISGS